MGGQVRQWQAQIRCDSGQSVSGHQTG